MAAIQYLALLPQLAVVAAVVMGLTHLLGVVAAVRVWLLTQLVGQPLLLDKVMLVAMVLVLVQLEVVEAVEELAQLVLLGHLLQVVLAVLVLHQAYQAHQLLMQVEAVVGVLPQKLQGV